MLNPAYSLDEQAEELLERAEELLGVGLVPIYTQPKLKTWKDPMSIENSTAEDKYVIAYINARRLTEATFRKLYPTKNWLGMENAICTMELEIQTLRMNQEDIDRKNPKCCAKHAELGHDDGGYCAGKYVEPTKDQT